MEDEFEKALRNAVRAIENVSKLLLEYLENLDLEKIYKPMKTRKRRKHGI